MLVGLFASYNIVVVSNTVSWIGFFDDTTTRIVVGLHSDGNICEQHICRCGVEVEQNIHGLSSIKSEGRFFRHSALNGIIFVL